MTGILHEVVIALLEASCQIFGMVLKSGFKLQNQQINVGHVSFFVTGQSSVAITHLFCYHGYNRNGCFRQFMDGTSFMDIWYVFNKSLKEIEEFFS